MSYVPPARATVSVNDQHAIIVQYVDRVFASASDTWFGDIDQLCKSTMFRKNNVLNMYINVDVALIRVRLVQVRMDQVETTLQGC